jgi:O-antigen ligase
VSARRRIERKEQIVAHAATLATRLISGRATRHVDIGAICAWTTPFALVTYLALRDGGYDPIVRGELGIVAWWIVLIGTLAGVLSSRLGASAWVAIALMGGFTVWTGLTAGWSVSPGDTVSEVGRAAAYLGFLVLALGLQSSARGRHTIGGLTSAVAFITVLAVLSRLHPEWFPVNAQLHVFGTNAARRLSYPLNYWNGLAAFAAMGVPLLITAALTARTLLLRALSAAVLPLSALCIFLTVSRGGVLELSVALAVFVVLVPRRIQAAGTVAVAAAGAAILLIAAGDRPAVLTGLTTAAALHQGSQLLELAIVVCAGVGLLQAAITTAEVHVQAPTWALASGRTATRRWLALGAVIIVAALAAGVPARAIHAWHQFTAPPGAVVAPTDPATVISRLSALNGNGRYQYWLAAEHAAAKDPLTGIGPGTFQYWWAQHATTAGYVVNAHSLYFETLAETGIVGLVLITGLFVIFIGTGVRRSVAPSTPVSSRIRIAGATASLATFATAAALDWVWQLASMAAAAMVLGAVLVAGREQKMPSQRNLRTRAILVAVAVASIIAISVPLAAAVALSDSQSAARSGDLLAAYRDSLTAQRIEPYAVAPRLQEALVLEAANDLSAAAVAARIATENAPTDWQAWLTLARIDARAGALPGALTALRRAESLDPHNSLWDGRA